MHVDVRKVDDVIIVDFAGQLVAGSGDELLRNVIDELVSEGWKQILLNLSEVSRIDSAGIGEIVAGLRLGERFGSQIKLLHVKGRIRDVLEISQLLPLLPVFSEEAEALASFSSAEGAAQA